MFTDKAQMIISMAKDRSYTLGREALDVDCLLAAIGADNESGVRLAECLTGGDIANLRGRCGEFGRPGPCPGTMKPDDAIRALLETACELASGEGIPDRTHPGLVSLEHLICAVAMSADVAQLLGDSIVPIGMKQAMAILARWLIEQGNSISLSGLTGQLRGLRSELLSKVFGQDHAVHAFVEGLYNAQVIANADMDRKRPMGIFVFAGPPGVGKTYMAELCAAHLKRPFRRFDMTGYSDHQANRELIGFAPSYVSAKPGLLTGFVKQNPNAILLFDEIEKAHLTTMQLFYQILDAGRLHDKFEDEDISFRDAIIIFTTNAGRSLYDNPNSSGIAAINANYHKRTILSALTNEKNPANGKPAFPQPICSRLGQGYAVMFNHLEVNELEKIADTEMARTEALLERQYFKTFHHDHVLPISLVFSGGANIDARQLRSEADHFVKDELFKFCNLYETQRLDEVLDTIDEISFSVDPAAINNNPQIKALFENSNKSSILIVAEEDLAIRYRKVMPDYEWITASCADEVISLLATNDVDMVLLDLWLSPQIKKTDNEPTSAKKIKKNQFISTDKIDFIPLTARALDTGREVLRKIHERFPQIPVYLLSFQNISSDNGKTKTIFVDDRSDLTQKVSRNSRSREIDEELFLACVRSGGARGLIATESEKETDENSQLTEAIKSIMLRLFREKVARQLARQRQVLEFDTTFRLNESQRHLGIWLRDFRLKRTMDAEDVGGVVSDVERPNTRFSDVIGADAAQKSLQFIVDWLREPKRYAGLGLRPPKGILMSGPPGTGKTILARAVAGESNCAFLEESAANFITKWQGSGPESVRALFTRARKYAPAILFIDEIDAVGKTRTGDTYTQAREITLNCILTEMDGFGAETAAPVIVLAATNLSDKLDPALKRRFDREIIVDLPDRAARLLYLKRCFEKIPRAEVKDTTLEAIANQSFRMTLANLERIVQEACIMALLVESHITDEILLEAFEKIRMGEASHSRDQETLLRTARHEAGHAFVNWKNGSPVYQVTIVGRGQAGGYMEGKADEEKRNYTKSEFENLIRVGMAGRAAEIVYYGKEEGLDTGASSDLQKASKIAIEMVRNYGMCDEIGQLELDVLTVSYSPRPLAEKTLMLAEKIVSNQMEIAIKLIENNQKIFDHFVDELMKHNRLDESQIASILKPLQNECEQ